MASRGHVTGVYKVLFYAGKLNMPLLKICAFDIVCDVCNPDAIPLPVNTGITGLDLLVYHTRHIETVSFIPIWKRL
jgi:hypothetical protein